MISETGLRKNNRETGIEKMQISDRPYHGVYNTRETAVPPFELPSPLRKKDGSMVQTPFEWMNFRRSAVLQTFREEMYGWMPPRPDRMRFELLSENPAAFDGLATRREIRIHCAMNSGAEKSFDLLVYLPNRRKTPAPVFLGLNGRGNHAATPEMGIRITREPVVNWSTHEVFATEPPDESTRGIQSDFWNFRGILERGYGAATLCISEIFYDSPDAFASSIYHLFLPEEELRAPEHKYGAIGAWAWGLSRALDCLEHIPGVDAGRVAVHGHSRLGKTALWAGACDPRFAMVISNESGCGGASLSRRIFGETIDYLLFWRDYWFSSAFGRYRNREEMLPFDQHFLLGLIAPRPLYVASAADDLHSDPKGEYLSLAAAAEVYRLFGAECAEFRSGELPPVDVSIGRETGYHIRSGEHDVTLSDWKFFLDFADRFWKTESSI